MDEGLLQAYVDDELPGEERVTVERHLGDCLTCRAELRDLRSAAADLTRGLLLLDGGAPEARQYAIAMPRTAPPRGSSWGLSMLPRAAVLVLTLGTAAAAMVPGSPLYRWLRPAPEMAQVERAAPAAAEAPAAAVTMAAAPEAGVSIEPVDGAVAVVLSARPELSIRASIGESGRAGVFATGAAAAARFETAPGRILVTGADGGELRIEMPRAATTTVTVNGRQYLRAEGGRINLSAPADARGASEVTFHP